MTVLLAVFQSVKPLPARSEKSETLASLLAVWLVIIGLVGFEIGTCSALLGEQNMLRHSQWPEPRKVSLKKGLCVGNSFDMKL